MKNRRSWMDRSYQRARVLNTLNKWAKDILKESDKESAVNIVDMPEEGDVERAEVSFSSEFPTGEGISGPNTSPDHGFNRPRQAERGHTLTDLTTERQTNVINTPNKELSNAALWNKSYTSDTFEDTDKLGEKEATDTDPLAAPVYVPYSQGLGPLDSRYEDASKERNIISHASTQMSLEEAINKQAEDDEIKGVVDYHGIQVNIEWPKGSIRSYEGDDTYVTHMRCNYGYADGTTGTDGDSLDVYLGDVDSDVAYVIEQLKDDGSYDEDKVMLGFASKEDAENAYLDHMPAYMLGDVREVPVEKLVNALYGKPEDRRGQEDLVPSEEINKMAQTYTYTISHVNGSILYGSTTATTLKECVEEAIENTIDLTGAYLSNADLSNADLVMANLTRASLYRANLSGANLFGSNLTGAGLAGVNFTGADLSLTDLSETDPIRANFTSTTLTDTTFSRADLTEANFTNADLTRINFSGADLSGADLSRANLSRINLDMIVHTSETRWPEGFILPALAGGQRVEERWVEEEMGEMEQQTEDQQVEEPLNLITRFKHLELSESEPGLDVPRKNPFEDRFKRLEIPEHLKNAIIRYAKSKIASKHTAGFNDLATSILEQAKSNPNLQQAVSHYIGEYIKKFPVAQKDRPVDILTRLLVVNDKVRALLEEHIGPITYTEPPPPPPLPFDAPENQESHIDWVRRRTREKEEAGSGWDVVKIPGYGKSDDDDNYGRSAASHTGDLLFVYGTLRDGESNHKKYLGDLHRMSKAKTAPYYNLVIDGDSPGSPGLTEGTSEIAGELFHVTDKQLKTIDEYERPYERKFIQLANGVVAHAYFLPENAEQVIEEAPHLGSDKDSGKTFSDVPDENKYTNADESWESRDISRDPAVENLLYRNT